jgi:murein DD-endopeptidase MepM/ murein hydrolase activator NlpD
MEKKFKFSDSSKTSKLVYGIVIAILCVSAVVIGIVAANNRRGNDVIDPPSGDTGEAPDDGNTTPGPDDGNNQTPTPEVKLNFVSPVSGTVIKSHSATVPVFSTTLEEWRIHTGIDISCEEGAEIIASEAGKVSAVYYHPMKGKTVEISHGDTHKTMYSNLDEESVSLVVGDEVEAGAVIGRIGDSSVSELAEEPHVHFELLVNGASVNPLDYLSSESKKEDLGIVGENIA